MLSSATHFRAAVAMSGFLQDVGDDTKDLGSLQRLARREDVAEMHIFKAELRQALRDPSQLPGDELSESVEHSDGSDEAFLRRLWRDLYADEPQHDLCGNPRAIVKRP